MWAVKVGPFWCVCSRSWCDPTACCSYAIVLKRWLGFFPLFRARGTDALCVHACHSVVQQDADTQRVMLRLSKEYPGDLGILMPLMLNLLQLKPGLAFFMTVDEPHAYLRGDILEVRRRQP